MSQLRISPRASADLIEIWSYIADDSEANADAFIDRLYETLQVLERQPGVRTVKLGEIDESTAADRRAHLNAAAAHWHLCRLSLDIVDRARRPFPSEPVRTLDAIHLASALAVRSTIPSMELLSLDDRIRRAGEQLGFRLQPR